MLGHQSTELDGFQVGRFETLTGILWRKIARKHESIADFVTFAFKECVNGTRHSAKTIDAIVLVTQSQEMRFPGDSHLIAQALGLKAECLCLDVNCGEAGFVQGLFTAFSIVTSGVVGNCLLVCGDTLSKFTDPKDPHTALSVSDGVSVTLVERGESNKSHFAFLNEPQSFDKYSCETDGKISLDYKRYRSFVGSKVGRWLKAHLELQPADTCIWHQGGEQYLRLLDKASGRVSLRSLNEYGNLGVNSIPSALVMHRPVGRLMLCGYGAGFYAALANVDFTGVKYGCLEI